MTESKTEPKKKVITINREHLNPTSSQKRNSSVKKNRKLPGFIKPSELKNNLIKLLKQKREETKNTTNESAPASIQLQLSGNGKHRPSSQNQQQPFNRQKYTDIFSKDFDASLDYLKTFKKNTHSTSRKYPSQQQQPQNEQLGENNYQNVTLDVPTDFTSPISLNIPGMNVVEHEQLPGLPAASPPPIYNNNCNNCNNLYLI